VSCARREHFREKLLEVLPDLIALRDRGAAAKLESDRLIERIGYLRGSPTASDADMQAVFDEAIARVKETV
jgi:hypothetical protein